VTRAFGKQASAVVTTITTTKRAPLEPKKHKPIYVIFSHKGGFYSEGNDTFVISSNRRTLLFS
jgi:hypothetical protein